MGVHQWLYSHVWLNEYSWPGRVLGGKCYGTQPRETRQNLPTWVAKIPIHSNLTSQTAFPVFGLWSAPASGCFWLHPMLPSFQATSMAPAPNWQLPPLPLESSSSESEAIPHYFLLWQQHSCCHCTSQCKCSVLLDSGAMVLHQHAGPESSHSTLHQWMQPPSSCVWFWMRRHQSSYYPQWWLLYHIQ